MVSEISEEKQIEDWTDDDSRRRMLSNLASLVDVELQNSVDPRFKDTEFLIEADSFAQHALWKEWHLPDLNNLLERGYSEKEHYRVNWEEDSQGMFFTIGKLAGHPVTINLVWAKLNGHRVCFYTSDSRVVDWTMIEEWLAKVCYPLWDNGTRHAHTNATNFHHCIDHICTAEIGMSKRDIAVRTWNCRTSDATAMHLAEALCETQKLLDILRLGRDRQGRICQQYERNKKLLEEYEKAKE